MSVDKSPHIEEVTTINKTNWPMFVVGCIFLLAAFAFGFYGFSQQNLTEDQRSILLRWALPIASAIASGAFAGSISVQGTLQHGLKVAAIGGFAVWLLSFIFLSPNSPPSNTLQVAQFNFLDESSAETTGVNTTLAELSRRSNRDYAVKSSNELRIAFGLVIKGFKVVDGRSMKIQIAASILDEKGKELATSDVETFDTTSEWQETPIAKRLTPKKIIDEFSLSENTVASGLTMPTIILLNNFTDAEIPKNKGSIRVRIHDALADRTTTYEERIGIIRTPPE